MTIIENCDSFFSSITRRKSIDISSSQDGLKRCLTALDLTAIGISSTLGAGLYVLAGDVAKYTAGPGIVISFLIAAIASILSALCYTEFAAKIPKAGTAYVYSYVMIGELVAFIIGWNLVLEFAIGAASVARAFSSYAQSVVGISVKNATTALIGEIHVYGFSENFDIIALILCFLISIILSFGIKYSAKFNSILTALNLLIVLVVISVGLFYIKFENWSNFAPFGVSGIIDGASTCFFAFIGFDVIATTAEEAKNPTKAIPISILGTIISCFLAYFGVSGVLTLMVPYNTLQGESALVSAFEARGATVAKYVIGISAGLSLLGTTITSLLPMPRLLYAMSLDGLLPEIFSNVNEKYKTPIFSSIFCGIFTGILAFVLDLHELVEMLSIGTLLAYSIVTICILFLRYEKVEIKSSSTPSQFQVAKENITESEKQALFAFDDALEKEGSFEGLKEDGTGDVNLQRWLLTKGLIMGITVQMFAVTWILAYHQAGVGRLHLLVPLILLTIGVIITTILLACQKQIEQDLPFRAPLVPYIPVLSLFVNMYLILRLQKMTWIRLCVWLAIGLVIYFCYGIRKSIRREVKLESSRHGDYIPLRNREEDETKKKNINENARTSNLYPSLADVKRD